MKKTIVHMLGPTGVGKSRQAVAIALRFNGEVISADALQVYRGFDIGTDKAGAVERQGVPHHLIDIVGDCSQFNAWHFLQESFRAADAIVSRDRLPIICGGTALYLRVQRDGIFPESKDDGSTRKILKQEAEEKGLDALWRELQAVDPEYAEKIGPGDRIRIVRALEIVRLNRQTPSELFKRNETPFKEWRFIRIGLDLPRKELYERIDRRVDAMIAAGLENEVRGLLERHPRTCPPFRGLGYREMLLHLDGRLSLAKAIDLIKQNSRRFAKRQLTWFRHETDIVWFHPREGERIIAHMEEALWKKP